MKEKIQEILNSEMSNVAKFNTLAPIFREHSDAKNELRAAVNLGYTEFRLKKISEYLKNKFGVLDAPVTPKEDNKTKNADSSRKDSKDQPEKKVDESNKKEAIKGAVDNKGKLNSGKKE